MKQNVTDQKNSQGVFSRRDIIKGGVIAAGALGIGALAGCAQEPSNEATTSQTWDQQADVVVVGAGGAGYAAAIEAANAGASVLLLEKSAAGGGDSTLCDGILGAGGSRLATSQGIDVSSDEIYAWFMENPEWYGPKDPAVARVLADKSGETVDWLEELGVPFEAEVAPRFGYTDLPVIHQVEGKGAAMMQVLADHADSIGITTLLETKATQLLSDESGKVVGLVAEQAGAEIRIEASKGVILTSGGYSSSPTLLATLNAECASIYPGSCPGNTGDGILMAQEFGAFTTRTADIPLLSSLAGLETGTYNNLNYHERLLGLWLGLDGKRFCDESVPYNNPLGHRAIMRKQNAQGGAPAVVLIGMTPALEQVMAETPLAWQTSESVQELATAMGLDGAQAQATVDTYNAYCAAGRDDDFGRAAEFLVPLTGPFYAAYISQSTSVTMGGIKINPEGQALKLSLSDPESPTETIPGLYAAGVACEWNTAAGATVLCAITMGRIAGQNASAA